MNINEIIMKKLLSSLIVIAALLFTVNLSLSAQEEHIANKLFYSELGGPGVIMSVNLDSRFSANNRLGFGFRLGTGFGVGNIKDNQYNGYYYVRKTYYSIPAGLNYVFGKPNNKHTFEVGAGVTFLTRKVSLYNFNNDYIRKPGHAIGIFTFMYRIMPVEGGFSFRLGLTPIIGTSGDLFPMGAIGFGYAF